MKKTIITALILITLFFLTFLYSGSRQDNFITPEYDKIINSSSDQEIKIELISNEATGSKAVNNFIKSYQEDFLESASRKSEEFDPTYVLDITVEDYLSKDYLSYNIIIFEYTGGANANQTVQTFTFNKNEEPVSLLDIGKKEKITTQLTKKMREMEDTLFPEAAQELSVEEIDSFYIEGQNLVIPFSKYEIAPGSEGIIEIELDLEKIK